MRVQAFYFRHLFKFLLFVYFLVLVFKSRRQRNGIYSLIKKMVKKKKNPKIENKKNKVCSTKKQ